MDLAQAYAFTTQGFQTRRSLEEFVQALENAEQRVVPPGTFGLSSNSTTFEGLANDPTELDACYDFWCIIVREGGEDRIAYFETREPD